MRSIEEIKEELKDGEQKTVAEMVGCTSDYVSMVLRRVRNSKRVIEACNQLIDSRKELVDNFQKNKQ